MTRLADLQKLRSDILAWMVEAPVDRKAALIAQYRATLTEIEELSPKEAAGDGIDEIAARRVARRPSATQRKGRAKQSG